MKRIARKSILKIKPYIPGRPIEEVKRELKLEEVIKLASNENALPPSKKVIRAAQKSLRFLNRYPDGGCFYLRKALAGRLGVGAKNIIVGNGSDEIIVLALRAFLKPGDEVIIAKPTFLIYEIASKIHEAKIKYAPLKNFRYDIRGITRLISKRTKLIFIANPDNPTGTYVTKKEIALLVSKTPKNAILFFDEAYFEFAEGVKDYPNTLRYVKKRHVIVTRSFSKIYSLAGLRIGYGVASAPIIDCLNKAREPFNVNSVAQAAGLAALGDRKHVAKSVRLAREGKSYIYGELDALGIKYIPSVTNFVLVRMPANSKALYRKLLERGIIVREMTPWKLDSFIRITVGTARENRMFINALKEILK